jgi:hypothetical protein
VHAFTLPPVSERPHRDAIAHSSTFTHVTLKPVPEDVNPLPQEHE